MNTTEYFKRTIQAYLEERAMEDELFAAKYDNPDKNIDDCVTYILNWVQKSGCNGFCDDEIYGQAIHYYEEKDIEVEMCIRDRKMSYANGCSFTASRMLSPNIHSIFKPLFSAAS